MTCKRVFTDEFRGATFSWPHRDDMLTWLSAMLNRGFDKVTYSQMRNGKPCVPKHMGAVLAYTMHESHRTKPCAISLRTFLDKLGFANQERLSERELLDALSQEEHNPFSEGIGFLASVWQRCLTPWKGTCPCDPGDVPMCVRELYIDVGRQLLNRKAFEAEAIRAAETLIDTPLDQYIAFKQMTCDRAPWSLVVNGSPATFDCFSLAVPITDRAFERIQRGELSLLSLDPDDVAPVSSNLIIEGFAHRARPGLLPARSPSLQVACTAFTQYTALTKTPAIRQESPLRFVAPAGMPEIETWLKRFGYKKLPLVHGKAGVPLYECVFTKDTLFPVGRLAHAAWLAFQDRVNLSHA